jgi:hypothetical protein
VPATGEPPEEGQPRTPLRRDLLDFTLRRWEWLIWLPAYVVMAHTQLSVGIPPRYESVPDRPYCSR